MNLRCLLVHLMDDCSIRLLFQALMDLPVERFLAKQICVDIVMPNHKDQYLPKKLTLSWLAQANPPHPSKTSADDAISICRKEPHEDPSIIPYPKIRPPSPGSLVDSTCSWFKA